jgi:hypothetical protein
MVDPSPPRFLVRQDGSGTHWMVWDRLLKRPAFLKEQQLVKLTFSAAETLRDSLNADPPSPAHRWSGIGNQSGR